MVKLFSVAKMIAIEKEANLSGLSYAAMMNNAGKGIAEEIDRIYKSSSDKSIFALVGSGNNGGDALVALDELFKRGWKITAYIVRNRKKDDPLINRLARMNVTIILRENDADFSILSQLLKTNNVMLDGVLGTGFKLPLDREIAQIFSYIKQESLQHNNKLKVIAVDCPSGVDCDTGEASSDVIPADFTITMAGLKTGLIKFPAANFIGELRFVSIGKIDHLHAFVENKSEILIKETIKNYLPERPNDSHKGTFGTALIIAGSANYTGAALLAGKAAYMIGAGLVNMAIPDMLHSALAGQFPEATWVLLPQENGCISVKAVAELKYSIQRASVILIGPGFGLQNNTRDFLRKFILETDFSQDKTGDSLRDQDAKRSPVPFVLDADGLKLLSQIPHWAEILPPESILTPHPGEMEFLTSLPVGEIQKNRIDIAQQYSIKWGHIVVLKGAYTVIAEPGGKIAIVPVATSALAKAGTGDVLAGLIAGLRAQRVNAFEAACSGAWIHAQAGLKASEKLGNTASVLATDVLQAVPEVISELYKS